VKSTIASLAVMPRIQMSFRRLRIVLTDNAWDELASILQYSAQAWGEEQRSVYQSLIDDTLRILAASPGIGQARDVLSPGLRSQPAGTHVIYYWTTGTSLIVAHILHGRQDAGRADWTSLGE
jgi:toxin ParE1/3/4